jgi:hypothetical protein
VATFTDANPNGVAGDFTATIDWGDGSAAATALVVANGTGGFNVVGSHAYAEEGSYLAHITISDVGGAAASPTTNVSVADATLAASGTTIDVPHGTPFTAVMARFTDADPNGIVGDYSATIAWGDGTISIGTIAANAGGGFHVTGTHAYAAAGTQTATITIQDAGGGSATAISTVNDDFPLTATSRRLHVRLGQPFNLVVASFTDADPAPVLGSFSATINWGDGTVSPGMVVTGLSGFNVLGQHTYKNVGGWNITVTIVDSGGASATVISPARLFPRASSY